MRAVLLFPGQGSQAVGMGKALYDRFPYTRELFALADEILGFRLSKLCFEGPEEELTLTANAQPALLLVSTALLRVLQTESGLEAVAGAGHSLGEFSALVAAGALQLEDGLRVVRERGRAMQEAVPVGRGAMAAVFGLDRETIAALCQEEQMHGEVVAPANYNGAGQIVIAGDRAAVERVAAKARTSGAKRVVPLAVSAPFHCALMAPAADRLREVLASVRLTPPAFPIVANVTAQEYPADPGEIRKLLVEQVTQPVRWEECLHTLAKYPAETAVEVGPGKVLTNLAKRVQPQWQSIPGETLVLGRDEVRR